MKLILGEVDWIKSRSKSVFINLSQFDFTLGTVLHSVFILIIEHGEVQGQHIA